MIISVFCVWSRKIILVTIDSEGDKCLRQQLKAISWTLNFAYQKTKLLLQSCISKLHGPDFVRFSYFFKILKSSRCTLPLHASHRGRVNPGNTLVEMRDKDYLQFSVGGVLFSQLIKRTTGKQSNQWASNDVSYAGTVYRMISSPRHLSLLFPDMFTLLAWSEGQVQMQDSFFFITYDWKWYRSKVTLAIFQTNHQQPQHCQSNKYSIKLITARVLQNRPHGNRLARPVIILE